MKTKEEIVQNWLPRYTGEKIEKFGEYILLTNFSNYVDLFAKWNLPDWQIQTPTIQKPYVEVGVGIENILKIFRIDAVWRLTYTDKPGRVGIRTGMQLVF